MTIKVGDAVPQATLTKMTENGPEAVDTAALFAGRTVALFAVPGAFTPTCSAKHLPGFIEKADELGGKGVDEIVCISVNDPFVMAAWGKSAGADGKISMLADGNVVDAGGVAGGDQVALLQRPPAPGRTRQRERERRAQATGQDGCAAAADFGAVDQGDAGQRGFVQVLPAGDFLADDQAAR